MSKYHRMSKTSLVEHVQSCGSENPSVPAPGHALISMPTFLCTLSLTYDSLRELSQVKNPLGTWLSEVPFS